MTCVHMHSYDAHTRIRTAGHVRSISIVTLTRYLTFKHVHIYYKEEERNLLVRRKKKKQQNQLLFIFSFTNIFSIIGSLFPINELELSEILHR